MNEMAECDTPSDREFERYVHQRFHDLAGSMQAMMLGNERLTILVEQNCKLIAALRHDVSGNGKPGIKAEVIDLARWQKAHDEAARQRAEELKEKAENQKWLLRWIMGILGTFITVALTTFTAFAWAQYKQVRALINNQETVSRQIQQLPGAKPGQPVVNPANP